MTGQWVPSVEPDPGTGSDPAPADGPVPARAGTARRARDRPRSTVGTDFDPAHNNMNFLRLALAVLVAVDHGWALGGFGRISATRDPGGVAVEAFFVISGFLITASRLRARSTGRFLWHRCVRIFPAYWVCLVFIAAVVAPIAWLHDGGSARGYVSAHPHGPFAFVLENLGLHPRFFDIAGTPRGVPWPPDASAPVSWDTSVWSLAWEFACYLGVAALGLLGVIQRRRGLVALAALGSWLVLAASTLAPGATAPVLGSGTCQEALRLFPLFLYGSAMYLFRERVPLSATAAAICAVTVIGGEVLLTSPNLVVGPALAYLCIWLGIRPPFQWVGRRHDLSYGIYIFAFPVQQLAAVFGVHHHGLVAYYVTFLTGAFLCGAASWFVIERRALRLKDWTPRRWASPRARASTPTPAPVPVPVPVPVPAQGGPGAAPPPGGSR
jgi:peptidoglycan/LPS O-acetylase OafA/YrhL